MPFNDDYNDYDSWAGWSNQNQTPQWEPFNIPIEKPRSSNLLGENYYGYNMRNPQTGEVGTLPYGTFQKTGSSGGLETDVDTRQPSRYITNNQRGYSRNYGTSNYGLGDVNKYGLATNNNPMPYFGGLEAPRGQPPLESNNKYWKMPDLPTFNMPTYTAPARNEARVSELVQKAGAAGTSKLARGLGSAISKTMGAPDSPMKREMMKNAITGYGEGVDKVMSGAQQTGLQQYDREYRAQEDAARMNYQGQAQSALAKYQGENDRINKMYEAALKIYFGR